MPEAMECSHMTGSSDFLLKIAIQGHAKLPDVGNMESFFVMAKAKRETACQL